MRTIPRLLAAVLAAALLAACGDGVDRGVAATVDGMDIDLDMLERSVVTLVGNTSELSADERAEVGSYQREFLGFFIQDLVYERALAQAGIELSDERIAEAIDAEIVALGGQEAYEAELEGLGVSVELFEALVRLDTRTAALREHVADAPLARGVRHILVDTESEALDLLDQLEGGADFGELAAEHSTDPGSRDAGGEYPPAPRDSWVDEFDDAVWEAPIGEVVGPVETMHGFHLIEVLDEVEVALEELRPDQLQEMTAERVGVILQEAFDTAEVTVASSLGTWDSETRQVVPSGDDVGIAPDSPGAPTLDE